MTTVLVTKQDGAVSSGQKQSKSGDLKRINSYLNATYTSLRLFLPTLCAPLSVDIFLLLCTYYKLLLQDIIISRVLFFSPPVFLLFLFSLLFFYIYVSIYIIYFLYVLQFLFPIF